MLATARIVVRVSILTEHNIFANADLLPARKDYISSKSKFFMFLHKLKYVLLSACAYTALYLVAMT